MQVPHEHRAAGRILCRRGLLSPYVHPRFWSSALRFEATGSSPHSCCHAAHATRLSLDWSGTPSSARVLFRLKVTPRQPRALARSDTVSPHCTHPSPHTHRAAPRHRVSYTADTCFALFHRTVLHATSHTSHSSFTPTALAWTTQTLHPNRSPTGLASPSYHSSSSLARLRSRLRSRALPPLPRAHAHPPSSSLDRPMPQGRRVGGRRDRRGHGARASCDVLQ